MQTITSCQLSPDAIDATDATHAKTPDVRQHGPFFPQIVSSLKVSGWTARPRVMVAGTSELKLNLIPVSNGDTF